jgi:hypothetical protein
MVVEQAGEDTSEGLRSALRTHLSTGPLHAANATVLDAATDAVFAVVQRAGRHDVDVSVVALVRNFHDDARLSASRFASGDTVADRANAARMRLRHVVDARFGDNAAERLMHAALIHGYLDPTAGHTAAQRTLHLSRSTYFRVLRRARARLSD